MSDSKVFPPDFKEFVELLNENGVKYTKLSHLKLSQTKNPDQLLTNQGLSYFPLKATWLLEIS